MHTGTDFFNHVEILVADGALNGTAAVFFVKDFNGVSKSCFTRSHDCFAVVANDIVHFRTFHIAAHVRKVEKALISFCVGRRFIRQHGVQLHCNQQCVYHFVF